MERKLLGASLLGLAIALPAAAHAAATAQSGVAAPETVVSARGESSGQQFDVAPNLPAPIRAASGQASSDSTHASKRTVPHSGAAFASDPAAIEGPALS